LRNTPRAGSYAALAPYAEIGVYKNNTVFGSFLYGSCRTHMSTKWVLAVKAREKMEVHFQSVVSNSGPYFNDSAQSRAYREIVLHFAVQLATIATYAPLRVMKQIKPIRRRCEYSLRVGLNGFEHDFLHDL
jgi:hypothetical protein